VTAAVCLAVPLLQSCSSESPAQKLAGAVNAAATEMLSGHESERFVTYHPETAIQYTIRIGKHFPCSAAPCEAPNGQAQGVLSLKGESESTGELERWISVPQQYEVSRKGQDTSVILTNKGWYAEVRAVY
jgi:hypothetical protein